MSPRPPLTTPTASRGIPLNPASTEDSIAIVKNTGLARSDAHDGFRKFNFSFIVTDDSHGASR